MSCPWVILDRDGVINHDSEAFITRPEQWVPIPGSIEAMAALSRSGWQVAVATNQSGLARGLLDEPMLEAIHDRLRAAVGAAGGRIDALAYCPHGPDSGCRCRKPAPGLYEALAERLGLSLEGVPVVGDSARDLEAALAVGGRPILVRTGKGERTLEEGRLPEGAWVEPDLASAVRSLLKEDTA